jgi:hypothetical protein
MPSSVKKKVVEKRRKKKIETLAWGEVVRFTVDGDYVVRAQLDEVIGAWRVTVYKGQEVVVRGHCAVGSCPEARTLEYLQRFYDRGELEKLINSRDWLLDNAVPERLWDKAVSASDDFLVVRCPEDATLYRIYPRDADGHIHPFAQFKEFYARDAFIRSPKDFPPEKIKEKWEEWHYPNEFYAG